MADNGRLCNYAANRKTELLKNEDIEVNVSSLNSSENFQGQDLSYKPVFVRINTVYFSPL